MLQVAIIALLSLLSPIILAGEYSADLEGLSIRQAQQFPPLGLINFDDVLFTCNSTEQTVIKRAFQDVHLLTDSVQGIFGDDPRFISFFGKGWEDADFGEFFGIIEDNLDKAKKATLDRSQTPKLFPTCQDVEFDRCKTKGGEAYTTVFLDQRVQRMVFCPRFFRHRHVADIPPSSVQKSLTSLVTYEYIVLHELMHFDFAGYKTAIKASDQPNFFSFNEDHIGDIKSRVSNTERTSQIIYGPRLATKFAAFKSPPLAATANADSYALLASAKFFDVKGQKIFIRSDGDPDEIFFDDTNQTIVAPEDICEDKGEPLTTDCKHIKVPTDTNNINLSNNCFTKGNRKWCDVQSFGSCQLSIGWDTSENGGKDPVLKNTEFNAFQTKNVGTKQCSPYSERSFAACVQPQGKPCTTGYTFCIKRVGFPCAA